MDMSQLTGSTLFLAIGVIFVVVLAAMLLMERRSHASQPAPRVAAYTSHPDPLEVSVETLASRRRGEASALERLLAYAAVTAPRRLRSTAAADLARAGVKMSPNVFLGIRGVLLVGVPLLGLLWVLAQPQKGLVQWGVLGILALLVPRLPSRWLRGRIKANQRAIERSLPYALD